MPSPLSPDPTRVQSCICCHSEPIVWRLHLSFYLSHHLIRDMNPSIGAIILLLPFLYQQQRNLFTLYSVAIQNEIYISLILFKIVEFLFLSSI